MHQLNLINDSEIDRLDSAKPEALPAPKLSPYLLSLNTFIEQHAWSPAGWRRLFFQMIARLQAVDCPSRANLELIGYEMDYGVPSVGFSQDDPVVKGIVRKAIRRANATCEVCGRWGRARENSDGWRTLCANCNALLRTHQELRHWIDELHMLDRRGAHRIVVFEAMSPYLRELLRNESWSRASIDTERTQVRYLQGSQVEDLLPMLEDIRDRLAKQVQECLEE